MALYHTDIVDIDLNSGTVFRSFASKIVGEGDINANQYGIRLWKNGEPINADGCTCIGYFIRHGHGDTVIINGGLVNGQEALITLPQSCYAYDGAFTLAIKLIGDGVTGTMRIVDGTVANAMIGEPIDPGGLIPDLEALLVVVERAETAASTIAAFSVYAEQIEGDKYRIVVNDGSGS